MDQLGVFDIDQDVERVYLAMLEHSAADVFGVDAIRTELEQLSCTARAEVLTLARRGGPAAGPTEQWDLLRELPLARGVTVRTIHAESIRNDPAAVARARRAVQLGAQVRTMPLLPLWMEVVDREVAVLPIVAASGAPGITVVRSPQVVEAFATLFDHFWAGARQLDQAVQRGQDGLTAQEASLLRLLSQGDTDHVIARKLGVSARTVGRVVSDLMSRLGAQSRFQAGMRASELGWLTGPVPAPSAQERGRARQRRSLGAA
ncbi:MAG TPA: LuxR C-terminal-related transcriptional regulator [Streptosporangiaceae bacterium]|nr:LuxR C-terminal-related transcriptional regulator [Streptosporangiaceae bacterium]